MIPRDGESEEECLTDRPPRFSIARKAIGHSQGSVSTPDTNGPYEQMGSVYPSNQRERSNRIEIFHIWWLELLCCVLFISALVAVVVTIRPYEGRPLPQWSYHLSINSLISIYVVILKVAMLLVAAEGLSQLEWRWFDQDRPLKDLLRCENASRGPWGSLTMLWRLRGSQLVSSCRAFITGAALVIDPFVQQVIATYDCRVPAEPAIANIPRTNNYHESGLHIGAGLNTIALGMQNSINADIFNPGRSVAFNCPTGNWTFPTTYHTVGYCSDCNDTTNELHVNSDLNSNNSTAWTLTLPASKTSTFQTVSAVINTTVSSDGSAYLIVKSSSGRTDLVGYVSSNMSTTCADTCPLLGDAHYDKCNTNWENITVGLRGPSKWRQCDRCRPLFFVSVCQDLQSSSGWRALVGESCFCGH